MHVCSESPEKRVSVQSGIREDFPERVALTLNLKEAVRISKAGDRRGKGGRHPATQGRQYEQWLRSLRDESFCSELARGRCAWDRPAVAQWREIRREAWPNCLGKFWVK